MPMTLLFILLAIMHLVQIGLTWICAAGHQWALPLLASFNAILFLLDIAVIVVSVTVKKEIDRGDG